MEILLFGHLWIALVAIAALVIAVLISEASENGFIAFWSVVIFCGLFYFYGGGVYPIISWPIIVIYLCIGLAYAGLKTFVYGRTVEEERKAAEKHAADYNDGKFDDRDLIKRRKDHLKGNFIRWWSNWPASALYWLFTDLLKDLFSWLYDKIDDAVEGIFDLGMKSKK